MLEGGLSEGNEGKRLVRKERSRITRWGRRSRRTKRRRNDEEVALIRLRQWMRR